MNYSLKLDPAKLQGAHLVKDYPTRNGRKKAIVLILDESKSIEENEYGFQLSLSMIAKKEPGKGGTHFLKESLPKDASREDRDALPFLGNAWELERKTESKPLEEQYQPYPTNSDQLDDLPF